MQNGKLNTSQRQALVKLVQTAYNRRIETQRELYNDSLARITKELKTELGVSKMDDEIKALEQKIKELRDSKQKLGFSEYSDSIIPGSEAKKLIDQKANLEKAKVTALESQLEKALSAIWLTGDINDVKAIIDSVSRD